MRRGLVDRGWGPPRKTLSRCLCGTHKSERRWPQQALTPFSGGDGKTTISGQTRRDMGWEVWGRDMGRGGRVGGGEKSWKGTEMKRGDTCSRRNERDSGKGQRAKSRIARKGLG